MSPTKSYRERHSETSREWYRNNKAAINLRRKSVRDAKKVVPCRECGGETVKRRGVHWCEKCQRTAPLDLRVKLTPEEAERRRLERNREYRRKRRKEQRNALQ